MARGVYFDGRRVNKPGAYFKADAEAMVPTTIGANNIIGVIGIAEGGTPGEILKFSNPLFARETLKGGDLLTAMEIMWNPGVDTGGADLIYAVRVNPATQSTLNLLDSAATPATALTLTSLDYGVATNDIRVKVETGSVFGKVITINDEANNVFEVSPDLSRVIALQYTGTGTTAVLTINQTANTLTITVSGVGAYSRTFDLTKSAYNTVVKLASEISTLDGMDVNIITGFENVSSLLLNEVAGQDIKTAEYNIESTPGAMAEWINNNSALVEAAIVGDPGAVVANLVYTNLAGGTEGTASNNDWRDAIALFQSENVSLMTVVTSSEAIHLMLEDHLQYMSGVGRSERVGFVGHGTGETITQIKNRAFHLNSDRMMLASPGIKRVDSTGELTDLSAVFTAAAFCGMAAGVDATEPLTNKFVNTSGIETVYNDAEIRDLIDAGVAVVELVSRRGYRIVWGQTTWLRDDNMLYRELSVRRGADLISIDIRDELEQRFVGKKGLQRNINAIKTLVERKLRMYVKDEIIVAYQNITVVFSWGVAYVEFEVAPVEPINFVLVTSHFKPAELVAA